MAAAKPCPQCGCSMPPDSPAGLCPDCLLGVGMLPSDPDPGELPQGGRGPTQAQPTPGFIPPKPHELADRFPNYEILDLLGYGGMGAVYKARQKSLDRLVALKIIKPDAADDPGFAERFLREARALARLNHANIVRVYDFGQTQPTDGSQADGEPLYYFVMEYVDGTNLRRLIESRELPAEQAIEIIPQVCEALQFAHDEAIVHRDIKPENILVDSKGRVKIADFGLAKLLGGTAIDDHTLTGTHQVMGTPRYMAPEQMEGSRAVDHRADIYSLGVVFYEMLTGELPMGSFEPPSRKVHVDVRLDEVVLRSLAKEPERRYQHASDVKTDVESIRARGAGFQPAVAADRPPAAGAPANDATEIGRAVAAAMDEAPVSEGELNVVVLFFLFAGSVLGFFVMFMPWSQVSIETLPQAARERLEVGVEHTFEAAGHHYFVPVVCSLLALVLFTVTLVKTMLGQFPSAARAMLAAATGITLVVTGGLIFALSPMPDSAGEYNRLLRRIGDTDAPSRSAIREVQMMARQGSIDMRIDMGEPGTIMSMFFGAALVVASMFEMRSVLGGQREGSLDDLHETVRGPATALRWAAWSSPLAIAALIALSIARTGGMVSSAGPVDDPLGIALSLLAVAQIAHTVLIMPLMLLAASRMQSLRSQGWAKAGSIAAMLPIGISFVIGLPAGVWTLIVLAREDVARAFTHAKPAPPDRTPAAAAVRGPAIAMISAGASGCLAGMVVLAALVVEEVTSTNISFEQLLGPAILCALAIGFSTGTIVAGAKMLRLEQYELAISFCFMNMLLPVNPLGALAGIWSLVVLLRRDVKEAFGEDEEASPPELAEPPTDWSPLVFGLVLVVPLMAVLAFGVWFSGSAWVLGALALPWFGLITPAETFSGLSSNAVISVMAVWL